MYIETKTLPKNVIEILRGKGFHKPTIHVEAKEQTYLGGSSDGQRSYLVVVNLETGEAKEAWGSWGGSNMFVRTVVDDHDGAIPVLPNMLAIIGSYGYRNFASLVVHPSNFPQYLTTDEAVELTENEKKYIRALSVTSAYRQEYLRKIPRGEIQPTLASLIAKDLVKKIGNGYGLTVKGKNVRNEQKLTAY